MRIKDVSIAIGTMAALSLATILGFTSQEEVSCVNVYYDQTDKPDYWMGKSYSVMLQNLLGHFPEYQQIVSPIETYKAGGLDKCAASIYIGSYFDNKLPKAFLEDYAKTEKNVAWVGYNIWQLGDQLERTMGLRYVRLTTLDTHLLDQNKQPTFFKDILYKGETFSKFAEWSRKDPKQFIAPYEQTELLPTDLSKFEMVAEARHSGTKEVIPYIVRSKNRFFVADVPLAYIHEADRYLVFADVLFDILGAQPRHNGKYAFVRVEDIHPVSNLGFLYGLINVLKEEKVPINISLIPIFYDPHYRYGRADNEEFVPMERKKSFMTFIDEMKAANANFIMHGITHQYQKHVNPFNGASGEDFEFWDAVKNAPIAEDSVDYVLNRFEDGWYSMRKAGVSTRMWLTPHYQASPLDYIIFGKIFPWNVGRVIYYNHKATGLKDSLLKPDPLTGDDARLFYGTNSPDGKSLREEYFKDLQVQYLADKWSGQFFPYEIYGDVHGQRLIPECLGNPQNYLTEQVLRTRSAKQIIEDAKRNRVLRDVWASFFFHTYLLDIPGNDGRGHQPGDPREIRYLVQEIKKLGYTFIEINKFLDANTRTIRPEPIYTEVVQ